MCCHAADRCPNQVLPAYGRMAVEEQQLEGRFRAAHANLIHNAEMVAFMRGERPEREYLEKTFSEVRSHVKSTLTQKLYSNCLTGYVNKWVWGCPNSQLQSL